MASEDEPTVFDHLRLLGDFDKNELDNFLKHAKYFSPNPRKIKRITNLYRAVRVLAFKHVEESQLNEETLKFRRKLLTFLVLMELWPLRTTWILQVIEDDEQTDGRLKTDPELVYVRDLYRKHVESRVYDTRMTHCPPGLAESYSKVFTLDGDPELFDQLLEHSLLRVADLGSFETRGQHNLMSYALNFNPALKALVANIGKYREDQETLAANQRKVYLGRSLETQHAGPETMGHRELVGWLRSLGPGEPAAAELERAAREHALDGPTLHAVLGGEERDRAALAEMGVAGALAQQRLCAFWARRRQAAAGRRRAAAPPGAQAAGALSAGEGGAGGDGAEGGAAAGAGGGEGGGGREEEVFGEEDAEGVRSRVEMDRSTKDDKTGRDHIGATNYALVLAMLIHKGVEAPVVFGLYAAWGCGKSFIMNKTILALKCLWLRGLVEEGSGGGGGAAAGHLAAAERCLHRLLQQDESEAVETLYKYARMGCPSHLLANGGEAAAGFGDAVERHWRERGAKFYWQAEALAALAMAWRFARALGCRLLLGRRECGGCSEKAAADQQAAAPSLGEGEEPSLAFILNRATHCQNGTGKGGVDRVTSSLPAPSSDVHATPNHAPPTEEASDASETNSKQPSVKRGPAEQSEKEWDYQFVWWNAWLYSGSDNLWAGLIKELYNATGQYYGSEFAHAQRKARTIAIAVQAVVSLVLLFFGLAWTLVLSKNMGSALADLSGSFMSFVAAAGAAASAVRTYVTAVASKEERLVAEVSSPDFRSKLGFMAQIKDELSKLGDLLQNPGELPDVWDYLLPDWLGPVWQSKVKKICKRLWPSKKPAVSNQRPVKMVIFVDDLDRCEPEKSVEVLQSLVLLTEDTPFVILLAIDPRIVVTAVETVNARFFTACGVSGYEYVDKIVNIPFALPTLVTSEKEALCRGYLTGSARAAAFTYHGEAKGCYYGAYYNNEEKPIHFSLVSVTEDGIFTAQANDGWGDLSISGHVSRYQVKARAVYTDGGSYPTIWNLAYSPDSKILDGNWRDAREGGTRGSELRIIL